MQLAKQDIRQLTDVQGAPHLGGSGIEQLLWADNTLSGTRPLCAVLVRNEQELLALVRHAQYNPLEMASGATDLINEAATSKISGRRPPGRGTAAGRPAAAPAGRPMAEGSKLMARASLRRERRS